MSEIQNTPTRQSGSSRRSPRAARKAVVAGTVGHVLEWFDFGIYAYLAVTLANHFFPSEDPIVSLMASLATFGVGFAARPLGAFYFGRFGDRYGRRATLLVTILMMSAATLGVGVLPTFDAIGVFGSILLVLCRLLQGFSAGGEGTTAAIYLIEWAPKNRRGLYGSLMQMGSVFAFLLATLVVLGVTVLVGEENMNEWGWRIPFLIAGALAPLAYFLRRTSEESPAFRRLEEDAARTVEDEPPGTPFSRIMRALLFTMTWGVAFYFFLTYMPTYLRSGFDVGETQALVITIVSMIVHLACLPLIAMLSDRIGRKPLLLISCLGLIVLPLPMFVTLGNQASLLHFLVVVVVLGVLVALYAAPAPAAIAEIFPTSTRSSGMAIGYNISNAVFAGFTPFIATWIIQITGWIFGPLLFLAVIALTGFIFILTQRDRYREHFV